MDTKVLNEIALEINANNREKGFWDQERNMGEMLMLVVTELAEALEAHRKGRSADVAEFNRILSTSRIINKDPGYTGDITPETAYKAHFEYHVKETFEDEIADAFIRLFDLCGGLGIDIATHVKLKVEYNKTRERLHGKKY